MKHIRTLMVAIACIASPVGTVYAAGTSSGSTASHIQPWLGTWSCTSKSGTYKSTFTSLPGGKAMRMTDNSPMAAEHVIVWDSKRGKWIDQYTDSSGAYATLEGTPSGNMIVFKQVYPRRNTLVTVTTPSNNKYTVQYAALMKGKLMSNRDTCTRT